MSTLADRYRTAMLYAPKEAPMWTECTHGRRGKTYTNWVYKFADGSIYIERVPTQPAAKRGAA